MKKFYLLIIALMASVTLSSAQGISESWWGVRAGVNFSNLNSPDYSTDYLTGFSVGAVYSHPISKNVPLFLQSGLFFQQKGARDNGFLVEAGGNSKFSKYELEVPLLLGYDAPLNGGWSIQSCVGFYYSVALNGKFRLGDEEFDPYKDEMLQTLRDTKPTSQQLLHRSDMGIRVAVSALYNQYQLGFSYDAGIINQYSASLRDVGYQALSGCFTIFVGYNF